MQAVAAHHLRPHPLDQRPEHGDRLAAPVNQRRAREVSALARQDLALAVQREMIVVLGDEDAGEQAGAGHAARDRAHRRCRLHHPLALPAGLLQPRRLEHLQLRGDELEHLRHVLADQAQGTAAVRAALAGVENDALAHRGRGDPRLAAPARQDALAARLWAWFSCGRRNRCLRGGHRHLEILERQLQLLDLAADLLRARPELLPLELGDADPQRLDQRLVGAHRRRHPLRLRPLCEDDRLQRRGVIRQGMERRNHHPMVAEKDRQT